MSNKKGIKYNSKSTIILNKYTPEEIQKLLNSGLTKKAIVANLGVQFKAFDRYIEEHNLTPTVVKDLILATDLTKVYHHGFDS
jgi:hypothetical protein